MQKKVAHDFRYYPRIWDSNTHNTHYVKTIHTRPTTVSNNAHRKSNTRRRELQHKGKRLAGSSQTPVHIYHYYVKLRPWIHLLFTVTALKISDVYQSFVNPFCVVLFVKKMFSALSFHYHIQFYFWKVRNFSGKELRDRFILPFCQASDKSRLWSACGSPLLFRACYGKG